MEGELYYLSVVEKLIEKTFHEAGSVASDEFTDAVPEWGRYKELCRKYERENMIEKLAATFRTPSAAAASIAHLKEKYQPGSLGARLVTITFKIELNDTNAKVSSHSSKQIVLALPRTLDVYRVKGLLLRKGGRDWGLKPLEFVFELVHDKLEDHDDMPDEEIPDSTRGIGDWIGEEVAECMVRVKPRKNAVDMGEVQKMDLGKLIELGGSIE